MTHDRSISARINQALEKGRDSEIAQAKKAKKGASTNAKMVNNLTPSSFMQGMAPKEGHVGESARATDKYYQYQHKQ